MLILLILIPSPPASFNLRHFKHAPFCFYLSPILHCLTLIYRDVLRALSTYKIL